MRRPKLQIICSLVVALGFAACGGADSSTTGRQASATAHAQAALPAASLSPVARPKPPHPEIIVSTTTSTVDSGLLDVLQPAFEQQTGYKLTILSQGSGAALKTGERGEADVVLAHSPAAEKDFITGGHGTRRELVMHNDFIVVGPAKDPANLKGATSLNDVMQRVSASSAPFISRGDNSGTHALELGLWKGAAVETKGKAFYQESGSGMGQTLQIASEKAGYTITDRATYLNLRKHLHLEILRESDPALLNVYHVIQVDPKKSTKVNAEGATAFLEYLISPSAQSLIGKYGIEKYGHPLFVPDYGKDESKLGS